MIPLNEAVAKEHCAIFIYFILLFYSISIPKIPNWSSNMQSSSRYLA
jgi:hypothetical protein